MDCWMATTVQVCCETVVNILITCTQINIKYVMDQQCQKTIFFITI